MDSQHHPAEHVSAIQSAVRLRSLSKRITCPDRHAYPTIRDVTIQLGKLARVRDRVEGTHAKRAALAGLWFDAVRMDNAPFRAHEVQAPLEFVAAGECKHTIQSGGRELSELIGELLTAGVDHSMGAQMPHKTLRRRSRRCGNHVSPALDRELYGDRPHATRGAKDQDSLPRAQPKRVYALECR
jgi:hypothetical protein